MGASLDLRHRLEEIVVIELDLVLLSRVVMIRAVIKQDGRPAKLFSPSITIGRLEPIVFDLDAFNTQDADMALVEF